MQKVTIGQNESGQRLDKYLAKYLKEGKNSIVLRICGSFQNLLGPHLNYSEYIPYDWSPFERGREAGPDEYRFFDWGLDGHPTLEAAF